MAKSSDKNGSAGRSRKKLPLILGASLIVLGAGGYVGYRRMVPPGSPAEPAAQRGEIDPGLLEMEPIVANLPDPAGDRFLRLTLRLRLSQKSVAEQAQQGLGTVKVRDAILSILGKKRATQLIGVENRERLRGEIGAGIDELLKEPPLAAADGSTPPCHVMEVYFTEFLLQ